MKLTLYMSTVFLAGLLSFFAPCTYALMPAYIGILADSPKNKLQTFLKTASFVLGLGVTFVTLGFGASVVGQLLQLNSFFWVMGALIIAMGLHQMDLVKLPFLQGYVTSKFKIFKGHGYFSAFWIGLTFSFAWTPCVGPVLASVLLVAAQGTQVLYGAWLMLVYTMGLATPFILLALLSNLFVKHLPRLDPFLLPMKRLGGALIILMGLLIMTQQLSTLTHWLTSLI